MIPGARGVAHIIAGTWLRRAESSPTDREQGTTVRHIRLGNELKSALSGASEAERQQDRKRAADGERHRIARELGLPVDKQNRVL